MTDREQIIMKVGLCRLVNPEESFEEVLEMCGITIDELKKVLEKEKWLKA